jgi:hypothetical protein
VLGWLVILPPRTRALPKPSAVKSILSDPQSEIYQTGGMQLEIESQRRKDSEEEPTREEEQGEASEPDAPTAGVENAGMSTILDGDIGTGVQDDSSD